MTAKYLLNDVGATIQTNINNLSDKVKKVLNDLQQNLKTGLQNISEEINKVEQNFLGTKSQTTDQQDSPGAASSTSMAGDLTSVTDIKDKALSASNDTEGHTRQKRSAQFDPEDIPDIIQPPEEDIDDSQSYYPFDTYSLLG